MLLPPDPPQDVARVEDKTFICCRYEKDAGSTNNWKAPEEAYTEAANFFRASMRGRTMYVVPFSMGPIGSPFSKVGIELTDSIYVVLNMEIMCRIGKPVLDARGQQRRSRAACTARRRWTRQAPHLHFPEDNTIWSVDSGYGGNALLGKKCLALRIASWMARHEGWLAEHMLILALSRPTGVIAVYRGGIPERLRQDQSGHADSTRGAAQQGIPDLDGGRRHCLDSSGHGRQALGDQPGGGLLRRRAGHELEIQPQLY